MKVRRDILRKREELIEKAFGRARDELVEHVKTKRYEEWLLRTVKKTISDLGAKEVVIRTNRRDLALIERERKNLERETRASISLGDPVMVTGGVRVTAPALKVEADETFEGRLEREMGSLRVKVAETLSKDFND